MDLTKIDKPFGLLDREVKIALFTHWANGGVIEIGSIDGTFTKCIPSWCASVIYRAAEAKDSINWDHVSPEFICMARDKNGRAHVYKSIPDVCFSSLWGDGGEHPWAGSFASYKRGTVDWKKSLVWRPGHEPKGSSDQ